MSSFGEEDFQMFALNLPCSNSFGYYFKDNVGGRHHLNKLKLHMPKDYMCAVPKNSIKQFWRRRFSKALH